MLDMAQMAVVDFALVKPSGKNEEIAPNQLIDQAMDDADKDQAPVFSVIPCDSD